MHFLTSWEVQVRVVVEIREKTWPACPSNVLTLGFEVAAMDENLAPEPQWQFNLIRQISVRKDDGQRRQEN
jgi:hypothetical protein